MNAVLETACNCTAEELKGLSDEELFALTAAVEKETGASIAKQGERELALSEALARDLEEDWRESLDPALDRAVSGLPENPTAEDAGVAVNRVSADLRERDTAGALEILAGAFHALMILSRRATRARARALPESRRPAPSVKISGNLQQADLDAIDVLSGQGVYWIGEFFDAQLSARIAGTVAREALGTGLGREQVGRIMRGVISADFPAVSVPGTFSGGAEAYFKMLAGTVSTQASAFGALNVMADAGLETYKIEATLDARTTPICEFMNGRTFSVAQGKSLMSRILGARNPEEVQSLAGWVSAEEAETIAGSGDAASQNLALSGAGMAIPPYHGGCRTVVVPA